MACSGRCSSAARYRAWRTSCLGSTCPVRAASLPTLTLTLSSVRVRHRPRHRGVHARRGADQRCAPSPASSPSNLIAAHPAASVPGAILIGWATDRYSLSATIVFSTAGAAGAVFLLWGFARGLAQLAVFAVRTPGERARSLTSYADRVRLLRGRLLRHVATLRQRHRACVPSISHGGS